MSRFMGINPFSKKTVKTHFSDLSILLPEQIDVFLPLFFWPQETLEASEQA